MIFHIWNRTPLCHLESREGVSKIFSNLLISSWIECPFVAISEIHCSVCSVSVCFISLLFSASHTSRFHFDKIRFHTLLLGWQLISLFFLRLEELNFLWNTGFPPLKNPLFHYLDVFFEINLVKWHASNHMQFSAAQHSFSGCDSSILSHLVWPLTQHFFPRITVSKTNKQHTNFMCKRFPFFSLITNHHKCWLSPLASSQSSSLP